MRAVRLHAPREELRLEELPRPEPSGTQVLVRVAGAGVCHTDLHIVDGTQTRVELPRTLGHEIAGHVEAWGAEAQARHGRLGQGDPVLVFGGWGCGACRECARGQDQRCDRSRSPGFQEDGGYADYVLVPSPRYLIGLGRVDPVRAAPLADAGVTPYRAVRRAAEWLVPGARVLLIGFGGLGQFALQFLRMKPDLTVAVRELSPDKLALADAAGADLGLLGGDESLVALGLGAAADVVFDFVGDDESLSYAVRNVAPGGLVTLVGEAGGTHQFGFDVVPVETRLTTSAWGSLDDLRAVVKLAARGRLRWEVETLPLAEAAEAHRRLAAGEVKGRLVLVP
jgi:propanol-preferring alcohol dehydrogenase